MTDTKKDIRFILIVGGAMLALYILVELGKVSTQPAADSQAETIAVTDEMRKEVSATMRPMTNFELRELIQLREGKPLLLKFYASWCPHCRAAFPKLIEYQQAGKFDGIDVVLLSIDHEPKQLLEFFAQYQYHKHFRPYVYRSREPQDIIRIANNYGIDFSGSIPFMALLDENGKVVMQTVGIDWRRVDRALKKVK